GAHRGAAGPRLSEPRRHSWHNAPDGAAPGAAPPDIPPQETLPLSDQPEGLQIVQHLGQTYRAMQAAFSSRVGHALPRWRILLTLHECGQCSQKLLAERCRLDPASLTRLLQAMQQQGWVTRSADPHDNRVTNAALTPAGQAVVDQALPRRAAFFEEALQGLSSQDIAALNRVLGVLERNFAQAAAPRAESGG